MPSEPLSTPSTLNSTRATPSPAAASAASVTAPLTSAPTIWPGCTGSVAPGPDAIYRVTLAAGDALALSLAPQAHDGAVYLLDGCSLTAACRGGADALGVGAIDATTIAITTSGTYYLVVDASAAGAAGCYALAVAITR